MTWATVLVSRTVLALLWVSSDDGTVEIGLCIPDLLFPRRKCSHAAMHGAQMRESMSSKQDDIVSERFGEQTPMRVKFREVDPFNLWVSTRAATALAWLISEVA